MIRRNYRNDLEEIAQLAQDHNKVVLISSIPINEKIRPLFSVLSNQIGKEATDNFHEYYRNGLEQFHSGNFDRAISYFSEANNIDDHVAIINYYLGHSYIRKGNINKGRAFLRKSFDDDGLPRRALSLIREIMMEMTQKSAQLHFVDSEKRFFEALDRGYTYDELFIDIQHPSLLGHTIIAHNFLCALAQLQPTIQQTKQQSECLDFSSTNFRELASFYKKELNLQQSEELILAYLIARWHINMSQLTAYQEDFLSVAEDEINKFFKLSEKTKQDKAVKLFFQAMIDGQRGFRDKSLLLANQAHHMAPILVEDLLFFRRTYLPSQDNWIFAFRDFGVTFAEREKKFILSGADSKKGI